ncbi:DUF6470 domain-containing protein [Paenibacillus sediminis]|uniref:Uncharacterized protein n=1 Tax=Paenibacillus sediminis TaxID=664909 RepID=A0ABS4H2B5_9BACL|nr:DUF6470 family protein [Paenibacillus sediminis]MBP1936661.1 hypothetical protein [Paenibacillus sediminis]
MNLQRLSIRQTYANIGMETRQAQLNIESPSGDLEVESPPAAMEVNTTPAELSVDSSRAWMALGKGNHLEWLHMISSQMHQEFLLNVSRIVDEGNQLAQFKHSTIADMMAQRMQEQSSIQYNGEASFHNVDLQYTPSHIDINWTRHDPQINYTPHRPQAKYEPGGVDIYLKNKNSIQMWVSNYDLYG